MAACTLKDIPKDIWCFLVDIQSDIKKTRQLSQYSMESTILKVLNDSRKCLEETYKKEFETEGKKK